jgi:hypothetical protein
VIYESDPSCDPANNCATGELELSIDLSNPTVTCGPTPTFTLNQPGASVSATVTDTVSGPEASPVSAPADTSAVGSFSADLTGTDLAGRTAMASCPYDVVSAVALDDARLWVGLKNSDDQGTRFDIKVELLKNGTPIASGLERCVTGVTRNAALAREVLVGWDPFAAASLTTGDVLELRVSTRIGTNPNDTKCGPSGHNNAVGLRLYYDATSRASSVGAAFHPDPSVNLYLRSNGNACGNAESTGVTTRTLDPTAPTATSAKCKDSASINFAGGNPFKVIGIWSRAPQA